MAPRRKPAAPTYSQLFGDDSGASSSGPSSSDAVPDSQTSQRVSWSPPPPLQMPPPPPPAAAPQPTPTNAFHPDLRVPSYAPYARYTVEDLLVQPGREGLKVLDPDRPPRNFWFGVNNRVILSVSETMKGYYDGAFPNWSMTPDHVKTTWFKCFAVAPKQKGRTVGIGSVNEVARATSSYTSKRVRLDSLEDLLDVMAVRNPTMQRMLSERRAALGLPVRDPEESDLNRQQPSNPTDYFKNM
uniref:Uncharacterized protein n=1 Tax=Brassica oleracea var. oleracea TaxID=109376 RepID=A0A0D3BFS1_BRAOL